MRRLRPLSEEECYLRCYGSFEATVRLVQFEPRRPRGLARITSRFGWTRVRRSSPREGVPELDPLGARQYVALLVAAQAPQAARP